MRHIIKKDCRAWCWQASSVYNLYRHATAFITGEHLLALQQANKDYRFNASRRLATLYVNVGHAHNQIITTPPSLRFLTNKSLKSNTETLLYGIMQETAYIPLYGPLFKHGVNVSGIFSPEKCNQTRYLWYLNTIIWIKTCSNQNYGINMTIRLRG